MKLTPKGRQCLIIGSSLVLAAIEDGVPLETLPYTPEEIAQMIRELKDGGYIKKGG